MKAKPMKKLVLATACVLGSAAFLATTTNEAAAADMFSVSGQIGYGFNGPDGTDADINPYNFALGLRADISFLPFLFIGGNFMYYFGETPSLGGVELKNVGSTQLGATLGVALDLGPVGIRPYVMGGVLLGRPGDGDSTDSFFVAPGAAIVYRSGIFFIGPEARYTIATADNFTNSFGLYGTLGLGF